MEYTSHHFIAPKDCPFTYDGTNLAAMRRAALRRVAKSVGSTTDGTKNEIVGGLIVRLKSLGCPKEVKDLEQSI